MVLKLLVSLMAVSQMCLGEECDSADAENVGRHGMLQVTRARETMATENDNGDTTSLLAMKAQLKSKLDMGERLAPEETTFFTDFLNFLENTSLANINASFATAQEQIDAAKAQFDNCAAHYKETHEHGEVYNHQATVNSKEQEHLACRAIEETLWPRPNVTCKQNLDQNFVATLAPPTTDYPGKELWADALMTQWLEAYHSWHCVSPVKKETFDTLAGACKSDADAAKNQRILCKQKQKSFEIAFCSYTRSVSSSCSVTNDCYGGALINYGTVVKENSVEVEYLKVEYQIIKTIICYIQLLIGTGEITTAKKEQCEQHWDDAFLTLNTHSLEIPDTPTCEPNVTAGEFPVEPKPCSAAFIDHYYVNKLDATTPAAVCTPCSS